MSAVAHVDLPLRGLASEGIGPIIEHTLCALPGVVSAVVYGDAAFLVHVEFDPARTDAGAIREALSRVGISEKARNDAGREEAP